VKKLVFIVGLANGGKTTTLYRYINRKRLSENFTKKINGYKFHFSDKSNCDISIPCWLHKVYKIKEVDNLVTTFCIDFKKEICKLEELDINFVIKKLKSLGVDIYFYILPDGRDGTIDQSKVKILEVEFGINKIKYCTSETEDGDLSVDFKKYMREITTIKGKLIG